MVAELMTSLDAKYNAVLALNEFEKNRFEQVMKPLWDITLPQSQDSNEFVPLNTRHPWLRITASQDLTTAHQPWGRLVSIFLRLALYLVRHPDEAVPMSMQAAM